MNSSPSPYVRIWRGNKISTFDSRAFLDRLAFQFIPETARVAGKYGLKAYLVAIPPETENAAIPDEIAFLVYRSDNDYKRMNSTAEGQKYGQSHWDLFQKTTSRSLVPVPFSPAPARALETGVAYDLLGVPIHWDTGHTILYLGLRKPHLKPETFVQKMHDHFKYVRAVFSRQGLRGYHVLLTGDYEIAFMNWRDEESMKQALASPLGKVVIRDGQKYLDNAFWKPPKSFNGRLEQGDLVKVPIK